MGVASQRLARRYLCMCIVNICRRTMVKIISRFIQPIIGNLSTKTVRTSLMEWVLEQLAGPPPEGMPQAQEMEPSHQPVLHLRQTRQCDLMT